ncbi:MAG: alpha/beta fold hydrolase [Paracoccaceae bacterium]
MIWRRLVVRAMWGAAISLAVLGGGAFALDRVADLREARAEAEFPPLGQFIEVEGRSIHAFVRGAGPDLVLIHGAGGNLRDWTLGILPELAKHFRVIAFDRPGLGWSDRAPGYGDSAFSTRAETPREQARILQAAADQLNVKNPLVMGHSFGGSVALAWGLERPENTAALVVLSGASNPWQGSLATTYTLFGSALGGAFVVPFVTSFASDEQIVNTLHGIFDPQPQPRAYARQLGAALTLRRDVMRTNARQVRGLKSALKSMVPDYPNLPMPVEIIHGTADTVVPFDVHAAKLINQIPNATLTPLDGQGHMPHHTSPDAVVQATLRAAQRAGLH